TVIVAMAAESLARVSRSSCGTSPGLTVNVQEDTVIRVLPSAPNTLEHPLVETSDALTAAAGTKRPRSGRAARVGDGSFRSPIARPAPTPVTHTPSTSTRTQKTSSQAGRFASSGGSFT